MLCEEQRVGGERLKKVWTYRGYTSGLREKNGGLDKKGSCGAGQQGNVLQYLVSKDR